MSDNTSFGDTETAKKPLEHENRGTSDAADADRLRSSQPKYENWSSKDLQQEIKRCKHASEEELNRIGFRYGPEREDRLTLVLTSDKLLLVMALERRDEHVESLGQHTEWSFAPRVTPTKKRPRQETSSCPSDREQNCDEPSSARDKVARFDANDTARVVGILMSDQFFDSIIHSEGTISRAELDASMRGS